VLRLTGSERAVAEVAAVAEHVASLTGATAAFQLRPDVPQSSREGNSLVSCMDNAASGEAARVLDEIRQWARQVLGIEHVPAVWRVLAHDPRLLETTWRKDRLIMGPGTLDELVKGCAALAVAQFRQSDYWISYFTHLVRTRCGLDDRGLVEIAGAVMHYISFNTIAHGMRLEAPLSEMVASDVVPGGPSEHLVPGVRRPVTASATRSV
jgi:hypothetical protein